MATKEQRLVAAGTAMLIAEPAFALMHGGGVGFIAGIAVGAAAYLGTDDIERAIGKEIPSMPASEPGKPSLVYRMLNGKSVRGEMTGTTQQTVPATPDYATRTSQDLAKVRQNIVPPGRRSVELKPEMTQVPAQKKNIIPPDGYKPLGRVDSTQEELSLDPRFPAPKDMAQIIEKGFKPSRERILLMRKTEGYATEAINKLHHIGLAGSSGRGKTNTTRLIVSQLLACNAKVYMVNPNFAPVKHNGERLEDWRPIEAKLQQPVARNAPEIRALLSYFMKIFGERREREQLTPKRGADIFLVLGEWPVIVEEYPDAEKIIGRLLRQSRQYGIHVIAEFQDALIKTIGGNSGTRANYGTTFFFGGDFTTAKTLLSLSDGIKIDNNGLGDKGAVYLKSFSSQAIPGRIPFFSNKALYMLLGFPEDPVTDEIVSEDEFYEDEDGNEEDIDEIFARMPDIRNDDGDIEGDEEYPFSPSRDNERQLETPQSLVPIIPDKGRRAEDIDDSLAITLWNNGYGSRRKLAKALGTTENQANNIMIRIGVKEPSNT